MFNRNKNKDNDATQNEKTSSTKQSNSSTGSEAEASAKLKRLNKEAIERGETKSLKAVNLRNKYYYLGYRSSLLIFFFSLILFVSSLFFAYTFSTQPTAPLYIPLNNDGRYIELTNVALENKTEQEVSDFVAKGIRKIYTRDYINYTDQLMDASYFFTQRGFNTYLDNLRMQNILNAIKENQWVVSFTPRSAPVLLEKRVVNGYFTWAFEYSGTINYIGNKSRQQNVKIQVIVQRSSVIDSPQGMGINLLIVEEDK